MTLISMSNPTADRARMQVEPSLFKHLPPPSPFGVGIVPRCRYSDVAGPTPWHVSDNRQPSTVNRQPLAELRRAR